MVGDGTTAVLGSAVVGEGAAVDGHHGTLFIVNSPTFSRSVVLEGAAIDG